MVMCCCNNHNCTFASTVHKVHHMPYLHIHIDRPSSAPPATPQEIHYGLADPVVADNESIVFDEFEYDQTSIRRTIAALFYLHIITIDSSGCASHSITSLSLDLSLVLYRSLYI